MKILHRDNIPVGGFAGIKEQRLIFDQRIGGDKATKNGIGNLVYLSDANFNPHGQSNMHSHSEIDVVSIILDGTLKHEGSLGSGLSLASNQILAQRAGGEGFSHNEINPHSTKNRMIQIFILPEKSGEPASYNVFDLKEGELTHVYGGEKTQNKTLDSHTNIEVGHFLKKQTLSKKGEFLVYVTKGTCYINNQLIEDGTLVHDKDLNFEAIDDNVHLTLISTN